LSGVAAKRSELSGLLWCFDAFGDDLEAERVAHVDDRGCEGGGVWGVVDVACQ